MDVHLLVLKTEEICFPENDTGYPTAQENNNP